MAHLRATIKGTRGEASRLGTKASGLTVTANGWDTGVKVYVQHVDGRDRVTVLRTGGSHGGRQQVVAQWEDYRPQTVPGPVETCRGCGREELTCSHDPCPDVIEDRGEARL